MRRAVLLLALAGLAGCASTGSDVYDLVVVGNEELSTGEIGDLIADDLRDFERQELSAAPIDDAAFAVETRLRRAGFVFAQVDYEVQRGPEKATVVLKVVEGPRTILRGVTFEGLETRSAEDLQPYFDVGEPYSRDAVESAANAIESSYRAQGHLDAEVAVTDEQLETDLSGARIVVRVSEGQQYVLSRVRIAGELGPLREQLAALLRERVGDPWVPQLTVALRSAAEDYLAQHAYVDADVDVAEPEYGDGGEVELRVQVELGQQVVVDRIRLEGNAATWDSFVRSRVALEPGDLYRASLERESFRRLYRTGLFRSVELELEGDGPRRTLVVRVEELPSLELYVEPGWGSYEGPRFTVGVTESNVLGSGRIARTEATVSARSVSASIDLIDPWFVGTEITADLNLSAERREEPSFTFEEVGAGLFFTRDWSAEFSTSVGYEFKRTDVIELDAEDPSDFAQDLLESVDIASVSLVPRVDRRNDLFAPMSGFLTQMRLEYATDALGSEVDFVRAQATYVQHIRLDEDETSLALRFETGVIDPAADTETIPIQERFFSGGDSTVRSFGESELGPSDDNGEPLGGEARSTFSAEVRRLLGANFEGVVFYDWGTVASQAEDAFDFDVTGQGVGVGLRYLLPIGPIRLDVAWNPSPEDDEDDWVFHLALGQAF